jgi:hypothetical protein
MYYRKLTKMAFSKFPDDSVFGPLGVRDDIRVPAGGVLRQHALHHEVIQHNVALELAAVLLGVG